MLVCVMASEDDPMDISEADESPQLWTDAQLEEQRRRDAECEERRKALEEQSVKAEERRRKVARKLKGLGLRWKQVEQRRLTREESMRSLHQEAAILIGNTEAT
ncbi:uncharacterized protein LOC135478332 [Liolophura sinensis]|uniref:uncharacterized protein LOC135478332 n=1 Tax=Liolophura sinensis TaxID=3198878 RepID=UPI00315882D9